MGDNDQYLQMFFDESAEYIQTLNENILLLEENPENEEVINSLFRSAHSLKGMAATMGFNVMTDITHKLENMLDKVRNNEIAVTTPMIDLLFSGIDHIAQLVEKIRETGNEELNLDDYLTELESFLAGEENSSGTVNENNNDSGQTVNEETNLNLPELDAHDIALIKENKTEADFIYYINIILDDEANFKNARASMLLKACAEMGYLVKSSPAREGIGNADLGDNKIILILVSHLDLDEIKKELITINDVKEVILSEIELDNVMSDADSQKQENENQQNSKNPNVTSGNFKVSSTVRVDINKLDKLMNMIGELLINKTRLQALNIDNDDFKEVLPQLDRVTMELHHTVMQIRMEPVGVMFNRFPRMIRDLSRNQQKEINFVMKGQDTELDRSIIDELSDPMTHLLRNAVDHGIETPAVRVEKGKDETGTLSLRAYQKGSEIIIEVEDDGAGIDRDRLVEKAVSKGIINQEEAEGLDQDEKLELIFHPGLSTSDKVSDISGRGVGMDVVKRTIEGLDGEVYIQSILNQGTKFTISLPLTLAITEALMVKINHEIFAIPLNNIKESLMIKRNEIQKVKNKDVITLRSRTIPLLDSRESLNLDTEYKLYRQQEEFPAVIIQSGGDEFGLIVDELLQQQEIVIKSLGDYLDNVENISGATIIGDGEIALILDVRNIA